MVGRINDRRHQRQLREAQARVDRYVRAIGDGLDLTEVRGKLQESKAAVVTLETQLAALDGVVSTVVDRDRIARRMADWRGILRRGPVMARQILGKILPGRRPLALTPLEGGGVAFKAEAAWAGLFAGTVYARLVVPPG